MARPAGIEPATLGLEGHGKELYRAYEQAEARLLERGAHVEWHEREAPNHRDSGRRSHPTRDCLKRHEATRDDGTERPVLTIAVRLQSLPHRSAPPWAGDSKALRATASGLLAIGDSAAAPGGRRMTAGTFPAHRN